MRTDRILDFVIGPSVLDVGCAGHIPKPDSEYWLHGKLRKKFSKIVGLDLNKENVLKLIAEGYEDIYVDSAESFEISQSFDTIVAGELIEHLSNPGLFLAQCKKHLKPSGRIIVSTPYAFALLNIVYAFIKFPRTCQNDEHTTWFCPRTLTELSQRHGFHVNHWELLEDYELDNPSITYRMFALFMSTVGRVFVPGRLRKNAMLFVLTLAEK